MSNDPIVRMRARRRMRSAGLALIVSVAAVASGLAVWLSSNESNARESELRDAFCGLLVPIANTPLTGKSTAALRTIVGASRHGARRLGCSGLVGPGVRVVPGSLSIGDTGIPVRLI